MIKVGKVTGQVRLTGKDYDKLREDRWKIDRGMCTVCRRMVSLTKGYWFSMHLMHVKSKGSGGSDTLQNTRTGCLECHAKSHAKGERLK